MYLIPKNDPNKQQACYNYNINSGLRLSSMKNYFPSTPSFLSPGVMWWDTNFPTNGLSS